MTLSTDAISPKISGAQFNSSISSFSSSILNSSRLETAKLSENSLIGTDFDSEDVEPTSEELKSIQNAEDEIDAQEARMEECNEEIKKLEEELEELNKKFKELNAEYESETDADKKSELAGKIEGIDSEISSIISEINAMASLFSAAEKLRSDAVENYQTTVETVNKNLQTRSEEAKLLSLKNTASAQGTSDSFGINNAKNVINSPTAEEFKKYGYNAERGAKLAAAALNTGNEMSSTGWCFRGVIRSLNKIGVTGVGGASAYMAADQLAKRSDFTEISVSKDDLKKLPAGAVVVWNRTADNSKPHGHISISLGDGRESSDHITNQYQNCGNGTFRVFLPK